MSIHRLRKRVKELGRMVLVLGVMVIILGGVMIVERAFDIEAPERAETVATADSLATASLRDYASLEATRVAKMAEMMLGLGGTYTARCESVYVTGAEPRSEYMVQWHRAADADGNSAVTRAWRGANWTQSIQRMMAWRAGN